MGEIRLYERLDNGSLVDRGRLVDQRGPDAPSPQAPAPTEETPAQIQARSDEALQRGDYDGALAILAKALEKNPGDRELIAKQTELRRQQLNAWATKANESRAKELKRVLEKARTALVEEMNLPSPEAALKDMLGDSSTDIPRPPDLGTCDTMVVDPCFFESQGNGQVGVNAARRFVEPPEPGKTLSAVAFADSRYKGAFESPENEALFEGLIEQVARELPPKPGDLHRKREAWIRRWEQVPPRPLKVLSGSKAQELERSRQKVQVAYEEYLQRRKKLIAAALHRCVKEMTAMLEGMEKEGWWKPGASFIELENDPLVKAEMDKRAWQVRWYSELYLDEAEEQAFRELAARVTSIMKEGME